MRNICKAQWDDRGALPGIVPTGRLGLPLGQRPGLG